MFSKFIEPTLIQPTFVTHLPKELVPRAKLSPDAPTTVKVLESRRDNRKLASDEAAGNVFPKSFRPFRMKIFPIQPDTSYLANFHRACGTTARTVRECGLKLSLTGVCRIISPRGLRF